MMDASVRDEVIRDTTQFYTDLQDGILPAVSFVNPAFASRRQFREFCCPAAAISH